MDFLFCKGDYTERVAENPKVVLLDLKLPTISGFDVLRQIRKHASTRMIPVIAFTSSNEASDIQ